MPRVTVADQRSAEFMNTIKQLKAEVAQLKSSYANKLRLVEADSEPTLTVDGEVILWLRTGDSTLFLMARAGATTKKVTLS